MHQVIIKRSVTEKCWKWNDQDSHSSFGRQFNLLLRQTEWLKFIYTLRYKLVSTVVRDLNWISTNKANCSHYVHTSTSTIVETALLYLVIPQHPFCQLTASVPRSSITFIRKWCKLLITTIIGWLLGIAVINLLAVRYSYSKYLSYIGLE